MTIEETILRELSCAMQAERFLYPRDHSLLHASAIGSCRRKQGFELMGVEGEPHDSHFLSICDVGHGLHRQLQDRLVNVLKWVKPENVELKVQNDALGVVGHIDALSEPLGWNIEDLFENVPRRIEVHGDGVQYIIDIKTITSRPYLKHTPDTGVLQYAEPSSFERLVRPKKEHLLQTNLYAWMAKEMGLVDELPSIMIIYVGKDVEPGVYSTLIPTVDRLLSVPYKIFVQEASEEYINEAQRRARHIWQRVRNGELPGKDHWHKPESPAWQCEVCSFRKTCYAEEGYFQDEPSLISPASLSIIESYR